MWSVASLSMMLIFYPNAQYKTPTITRATNGMLHHTMITSKRILVFYVTSYKYSYKL